MIRALGKNCKTVAFPINPALATSSDKSEEISSGTILLKRLGRGNLMCPNAKTPWKQKTFEHMLDSTYIEAK